MDQKICLDTDVCIEIIKGNQEIRNGLSKFSSLPLYISSISVFELFLRDFNIDKIENFILDTDVINFDETIAKEAGVIFKSLRNAGMLLEFRDIFIAASCIVNNCSLLTLNRGYFERIKGLKLLDIK